jgi:hypothetical protein
MGSAEILMATRLLIMAVAIFERRAGRPVTEEEFLELERTSEIANRAAALSTREALERSRARQTEPEAE